MQATESWAGPGDEAKTSTDYKMFYFAVLPRAHLAVEDLWQLDAPQLDDTHQWPGPYQSCVQTPPSHQEKGLVTIERFLGCAKSAILIFE